ncbi:MAG: ABC transporter permease, partial [Acidobacteriaceae bacterium]|nr:ABC transporter permease [Acidobacteriaceae bacterium]
MPLDQDVSYSLRQMRKSPSFSCAVITTLALTVGVSTAAFSVLDAVFVRPLPYSAPERIVDVTTYSPQGYTQPASYPELLDWRKMTTGISALAGYDAWTSVNAETPAGAVALNAVRTTDNFFDVFGVKPALGRTFAKGDEQPGHNFLTVLSNEVWRESFGGKRDVIGSTVKLDGRPYIVIGVMPAGFRFPINRVNAVYFPPDMTPMQRDGRGNHWIMTIARLKAGISAAAAQQQFNAVLQRLGRAYPDSKGRRAKLVDLTTSMNGSA